MRLIGLIAVMMSLVLMVGFAEAKPPPQNPYAGDKRARCKAEASYIGGGGGKGAAQRGMNTRELRQEHVRKCMAT